MPSDISLPTKKGSYILILHLKKARTITIGKLGKYFFSAGVYVYVGSAFGSGGIAGRLKHHLNSAKNPHWHIDYFKKSADIIEIWYSDQNDRQEHIWADQMTGLDFTTTPVEGFGSSDCKCRSHFFFIDII